MTDQLLAFENMMKMPLFPFLGIAFYLLFTPFCSSAFHLSYNMLLNQLRCEDGDPENLLRNSFYQFQADRALPDLEVGHYRGEMCLCLFS